MPLLFAAINPIAVNAAPLPEERSTSYPLALVSEETIQLRLTFTPIFAAVKLTKVIGNNLAVDVVTNLSLFLLIVSY